MRSRNHRLALLLFFSAQAFSAGIPVFDAVQNTESINQWMQKLQQWEGTVTHYKSELNAYKKQLATATGVRDIQGFLSDARSLKTDIDNLRKNGISLDDLLTTKNSSYSYELQHLYSKYKSFSVCSEEQEGIKYQAWPTVANR